MSGFCYRCHERGLQLVDERNTARAEAAQLKTDLDNAMVRNAEEQDEHSAQRAALVKERDALSAVLKGDASRIEMADMGGGFAVLKEPHWAAKLMAHSMMKTLDDLGAENYVELTLSDPDDVERQIVVTLRRKTGKTPDEMMHEALVEVERLQAERASVQEEVRRFLVACGPLLDREGAGVWLDSLRQSHNIVFDGFCDKVKQGL